MQLYVCIHIYIYIDRGTRKISYPNKLRHCAVTRLLDGFLLLAAGGSNTPDEVRGGDWEVNGTGCSWAYHDSNCMDQKGPYGMFIYIYIFAGMLEEIHSKHIHAIVYV